MKYLLPLALLFFAGCATKTEYGQCVGIGAPQDPALIYRVSANNLIVGIVFFELVAPPVVVALDAFYCPVGKK